MFLTRTDETLNNLLHYKWYSDAARCLLTDNKPQISNNNQEHDSNDTELFSTYNQAYQPQHVIDCFPELPGVVHRYLIW